MPQVITSREVVAQTIRFQSPSRLPYDFPQPYGSDFLWVGMSPSTDERPRSGVDEWGAVWANIGASILGEVKDFPLKGWGDFGQLHIPDVHEPRRWEVVHSARQQAGEKFLLGHGVSIYERLHFIRGLENTWIDIFESRDELCRLIDILVEHNLVAIEHYAAAGFDGFITGDDWGLQNKLMIAPAQWREIWKPRYARIYQAAHDAGLFTFLHSCGYIVDILDDLIEIGLDVVHMDQQENMGLELLGKRFGGRITFFAPVDIQKTMIYGTLDEVRAYCRQMVRYLGAYQGGFIPRWYTDPSGAGHRREAIDAMCQEFLSL
jgi:uroporphyrinogen decarboxylase